MRPFPRPPPHPSSKEGAASSSGQVLPLPGGRHLSSAPALGLRSQRALVGTAPPCLVGDPEAPSGPWSPQFRFR